MHTISHRLPEPLRRRLVFGDAEQIKALRQFEMELEAAENEDKVFDQDVTWRVEVSYTTREEDTTYVTARSKQEAEEKVLEEYFHFDDVGIESCAFHSIDAGEQE